MITGSLLGISELDLLCKVGLSISLASHCIAVSVPVTCIGDLGLPIVYCGRVLYPTGLFHSRSFANSQPANMDLHYKTMLASPADGAIERDLKMGQSENIVHSH